MKQKNKKPRIVLICALCLMAVILCIRSTGPIHSGSAAADLKEALESVYGTEYTGKTVENGTEDMRFEIESTAFLRSRSLRAFFGLDDTYECRVVITTHTGEGSTHVRTISYQAVDPIGQDETYIRASIDWDSREERNG